MNVVRSFEMPTSTAPAGADNSFGRCPLRRAVPSSVRSPGAAPIAALSSASISSRRATVRTCVTTSTGTGRCRESCRKAGQDVCRTLDARGGAASDRHVCQSGCQPSAADRGATAGSPGTGRTRWFAAGTSLRSTEPWCARDCRPGVASERRPQRAVCLTVGSGTQPRGGRRTFATGAGEDLARTQAIQQFIQQIWRYCPAGVGRHGLRPRRNAWQTIWRLTSRTPCCDS